MFFMFIMHVFPHTTHKFSQKLVCNDMTHSFAETSQKCGIVTQIFIIRDCNTGKRVNRLSVNRKKLLQNFTGDFKSFYRYIDKLYTVL